MYTGNKTEISTRQLWLFHGRFSAVEYPAYSIFHMGKSNIVLRSKSLQEIRVAKHIAEKFCPSCIDV